MGDDIYRQPNRQQSGENDESVPVAVASDDDVYWRAKNCKVTWLRRESWRNGGSGLSVYESDDYEIESSTNMKYGYSPGGDHRVTANDCRT